MWELASAARAGIANLRKRPRGPRAVRLQVPGGCPDCLWRPSFEFNDLGPATIFECPDCFYAGSFLRGAVDGAWAGRVRRRRRTFW
jgi:hypothetical protein